MEKNELFDLAWRFVNETHEAIFLTGKAGTGKTTFLKYLQSHSNRNTVVSAPTGVAAINAGGVTLHSLFQLPLQPFLPTAGSRKELLRTIRYSKQRLQLLRKMELLVIDEVSMVRCDVLDAIDAILRSVRRNHTEPFGGVQLLYIGDLYQLPPVAKQDEWKLLQEHYDSVFFFSAHAVRAQQPLLIELTTIYRQKEQSFVELLNQVRDNRMDADAFAQLNSRYIPSFRPAEDEQYITLTSHNNQADDINQRRLRQLPSVSYTYRATVVDEFPQGNYPAEYELELREGAQVMFLRNDSNGKYYNGKIAIVKTLETDKIVVTADGSDLEVPRETWEHTRYTVNRQDEKLQQEVMGSFTQFPLRLAWAITIHKSQGLTFDRVMIDAAASFSSGQVYVALSRCTSLEGIVLLSKIPPSAVLTNGTVAEAHASMHQKGSLAERFAAARVLFTQQLLAEMFMAEPLQTALTTLIRQCADHRSHLPATALPWLEERRQEAEQLRSVAEKFMLQVQQLLRGQGVIEENAQLQQRIRDAAAYFREHLTKIRDSFQHHPLETEHRETAAAIDEPMLECLQSFHTQLHYLEFGNGPFSVTGFLKHKLSLSIPRLQAGTYAAARRGSQDITDMPHPQLYSRLRQWRDAYCEDNDMPIYMVASGSSLREICTYLPQTRAQLLQISGFGKARVEQLGETILDMVKDYCQEHAVESNMEAKADNPKRQRADKKPKERSTVSSAAQSLEMYRQGKTVAEIAAERNITTATVEGHLTAFIATGDLSVAVFLNEEELKQVLALIKQRPGATIGELKAQLGDGFSFSGIRAAQHHLRWQENRRSGAAV